MDDRSLHFISGSLIWGPRKWGPSFFFLYENIFSQYENDKFDVHTFDYKIVLDMERELL